ncbi:MAG: alpha/beta-type small acid-soluble spore protein [Oscillospiraceae bacterium]|nr:alpha/beta-type small acid-soluble spore protein [Oscillospiraceae bacterium]
MSNKQSKANLNNIKMQAANEVGVTLNNGYNGDLTARQAGSIGGMMVKKMIPSRQYTFTRPNRVKVGHIHNQILEVDVLF